MNSIDDKLHILLIDDDQDEYTLLKGMLYGRHYMAGEAGSLPYLVEWAPDYQSAVQAFDHQAHDVYLVDYDLGRGNGLDLLAEAAERGVEAPLIILTGNESAQLEIAAARAGAADFLVKSFINELILERSIRYAIERKRAENSLKQARNRLEELVHERTRELVQINHTLREEIRERLQVEAELNEARKRLEVLVAERSTQLVRLSQDLNGINEELTHVVGQLDTERARMSTIIANAPGALVVADRNGEVLYSNPAAELLFGSGSAKVAVQNGSEASICYPDGTVYNPGELPLIRSAVHGETQINLEIMVITQDGRQRHVLVNSAPILDRKNNITGAIALFQDITSHKKEEERARQNATRLEVQRRLMEYREKERLHIAQELHDGPIQDLLATTYQLSALRQMISSQELTENDQLVSFQHELATLQVSLQEQISKLRAITSDLRPPLLLSFGLEKAIRSHSEDIMQKNVDLSVELELAPDNTLSEEQRIELYRIYQELLNNIQRHAGATKVFVSLSVDNSQVILTVRDNGAGFDVPDNWLEVARNGHFGLVGIQERASAIDGKVDIHSTPGSGTEVRICAPLGVKGQKSVPSF